MLKGITSTGFAFEVPDENLDNMELLEALGDIDDGKAQMLPKAARLLLGVEQKKALYDHCRDGNGKVPIEKATTELFEILNSGGDGKN